MKKDTNKSAYETLSAGENKSSSENKGRKTQNNDTKPKGLKHQLIRAVSVFIIFSMLTISVPAAPRMIAVSGGEIYQDLRFTYLANYGSQGIIASLIDNPVFAFFFKDRGNRNKRRIAKVEINPRNITVIEGEQIALSAIAYDYEDKVIQGTDFTWSVQSYEDSQFTETDLTEGVFKGDAPGAYKVFARAGGVTAEAFIVVTRDAEYRAMKELTEQEKNEAEQDAGLVSRQRESANLRQEVRDAMRLVKRQRNTSSLKNSSRIKNAEKQALENWDLQQRVERQRARDRKKQRRKQRWQDRRRNRELAINREQVAAQNKNKKHGEVQFVKSAYKEKDSASKFNKKKESSPSKKTKSKRRTFPIISGIDSSNNAYGTVYGFYYSGGGGGGGGPFLEVKDSKTKKASIGGSYYAELELYIDGEKGGGGTFLGVSACAQSSCSWSIAIPSTYHDGQQHTLYAYAVDELFTMQEDGPTMYNFTIGSGAEPPEWHNGNFPSADDPGRHTGTPRNQGTVGAGSGNFGFSAPVLSLPGRNGLDVNLSLNYNSLLWHKSGTTITYDIDKGNPAPGWDIGFGKILDADTTGGAMLESPNGTRHSWEGEIVGSGANTTYYGRTTDGSFIDYIVSKNSNGIVSGTAHFSDGTKITYGAVEDGVIYPTQIKDAHGNYITITYVGNKGPNINTITDTLGRVVTFKYANGRLINIQGPGYNGTTRTHVRLHYEQKTLSATFSGLTKAVRDESPYQIKAIYYPITNTGYWFGDSDSYSSYGMIKKLKMNRSMSSSGTTTTEGSVTNPGTMSTQTVYNYPATASNLTSAPKYTTKTDTWANMDTAAAVTQYAVNNTASPRTTTVTLPNGTKTRSSSYNTTDWKNGILQKSELLSGITVLNKTEMTWDQGDYNSTRVTQILNTDEKSQQTKQTFTYGTHYNQVTEAREYGYSPSTVYRKTITTYENTTAYRGTYSGTKWMSGRHIFNLPKTVEVKTGGNVRLSRVNYTYDTGSLTDRSTGLTNYDQTYRPASGTYDSSTAKRGNVTSTTVYAKASDLTGAITYDYTYDIAGNNITATTNCCQQITTTYTSATKYAYPTSVRRGKPTGSTDYNTTSATYDFNTGAAKTSTDANGRVTTAAYDAIARPTQVTLSTGGKVVYEYFPNTLTSKQTVKLSNNTIVSQSTTITNGRGQPRISKLLTGTSSETATKVEYDNMGRQDRVSNPYPATGSPSDWTSYTYDNQSRVTQITAPDGSTTKTFYNETTKPSSATTTQGSTVRRQDAWGRERWGRSDAYGRLVEVVEPNPNGNGSVTASGNMVTDYTYDEQDNLTQIDQGSQQRKFKYDSLGRMTRQKLAEQTATINDLGVFVNAGGSGAIWSDSFTYDNRSNLTQRIDARGVKTNFSYLKNGSLDPLNRLHAITFDKTQADTANPIYESPDITYSYMTMGDKERIYQVTSGSVATETYTYDTEGRVSDYEMKATSRASYPMKTSYLYDTVNRLTEVRYPKAYGMSGNPRKVVDIAYDQTSRLKELKVDNSIQMNQISYNDFGQATAIKIGAGGSNPIDETYSFDSETGLMTNQKVKRGTNTLMDLTYNYNRGLSKGTLNGKTGQLTHIIDNKDRNKDRVYEHDSLGRLIKAKGGLATGVTGVTANWTQSYTYDRYGNKETTSKTGTTEYGQAIPLDGLASLSYTSSTNRIIGYNYDNAGNQIRGKSPTGNWQVQEYDEAGRLVYVRDDSGWIEQANEYASSRERLASWSYASVDITYYAWGGSSVLAEYTTQSTSSSLEWDKTYIYAGSRLLSTFTKTGSTESTEYHHPDRLGTRMISNPTGGTEVEQMTLPFGTSIDAETSGTSNQRFTSYDRSSVTGGLDYAINRTYNSGQSRFTQVDPIGMAAAEIGNPQSFNMYAYVENNPIDFVDPRGLDEEEPFLIIEEWTHRITGGGSRGSGGGASRDNDNGRSRSIGRGGGGSSSKGEPKKKILIECALFYVFLERKGVRDALEGAWDRSNFSDDKEERQKKSLEQGGILELDKHDNLIKDHKYNNNPLLGDKSWELPGMRFHVKTVGAKFYVLYHTHPFREHDVPHDLPKGAKMGKQLNPSRADIAFAKTTEHYGIVISEKYYTFYGTNKFGTEFTCYSLRK